MNDLLFTYWNGNVQYYYKGKFLITLTDEDRWRIDNHGENKILHALKSCGEINVEKIFAGREQLPQLSYTYAGNYKSYYFGNDFIITLPNSFDTHKLRISTILQEKYNLSKEIVDMLIEKLAATLYHSELSSTKKETKAANNNKILINHPSNNEEHFINGKFVMSTYPSRKTSDQLHDLLKHNPDMSLKTAMDIIEGKGAEKFDSTIGEVISNSNGKPLVVITQKDSTWLVYILDGKDNLHQTFLTRQLALEHIFLNY